MDGEDSAKQVFIKVRRSLEHYQVIETNWKY